MVGSYFSLVQWQELELQALIFRHMEAGAAVPPELLQLVKKSIVSSSTDSQAPPYYICSPLHQYYTHYQSALMQTGYWGRAAMDPEPGRCRRTDGKKWRCSRDVVAGQKYCERHMHRGRNRSRKPVETPTSASASASITTGFFNSGDGGEDLKAFNNSTECGGGDGTPQFTLSAGPSALSMGLLQNKQRPLDSMIETKCSFDSSGQAGGDPTLRPFFDDWPRSVHETNDAARNLGVSATSLSISMPGNGSISASSDFSLKLGTGNEDEPQNNGRERQQQLSWGTAWEANSVSPLGGPLAEALRSSTSTTTSSPISVLHRLPRNSASETSYVSS